MANLIDDTYFYGDLLIVGIGSTSQAQLAKTTSVNNFITVYEKDFLRNVLGDDLYDAFMAGMAETTPDTRWTSLANQLRNSTTKYSPIANYVWYKWQQQSQQLVTATGDKSVAEMNMVRSLNYGKYVNVWNAMKMMLDDFYEWLNDNISTYPEYEGSSWYYSTINQFGI